MNGKKRNKEGVGSKSLNEYRKKMGVYVIPSSSNWSCSRIVMFDFIRNFDGTANLLYIYIYIARGEGGLVRTLESAHQEKDPFIEKLDPDGHLTVY